MKASICLLLLLSFRYQATAQNNPTASQAYEYLQNERKRAEAPWQGNDQPPLDSLKIGEQILQGALEYYHRPEIQELAKNNESLFYRKGTSCSILL